MTMSNQCKWISFGVMSLTVILLLLLFYSLASKSKCPEEDHLRFKEDEKCYKRYKRGPCPAGFVIAEEEPKSAFGECGCPYMLTNRSLLYHNGRCHYIFTKAYCPKGHWLNVTRKGEPFCEANPCLQHIQNGLEDDNNANDDGEEDTKSEDHYDENMHNMNNGNREEAKKWVEWVPIKGGRCAQLGSTMEGCPNGTVVRFHANYILPSCHSPPPKKFGMSTGAIGVGAYMTCPLGSAKAITGFCQPLFDFDFEEPGRNQSEGGKNS